MRPDATDARAPALFDEKTGQELLETLNSVFAHLSKDHGETLGFRARTE